ncbi:ABC transporter permease, partial [Bradyrhizobium sp. Arg68]|nr:ABC transporter permease [Bradyrhizobium ivorense]
MSKFWRTMLRNPGAAIGLVILLLAIAIAIFG